MATLMALPLSTVTPTIPDPTHRPTHRPTSRVFIDFIPNGIFNYLFASCIREHACVVPTLSPQVMFSRLYHILPLLLPPNGRKTLDTASTGFQRAQFCSAQTEYV